MTPHLGSLPDGTRGFDANARIAPDIAQLFYDAGYRFAVRYVRRAPVNPNDITAGEMAGLLDAGLGVMLVQHVASENQWRPSGPLGSQYGITAAEEAARVGYPRGAHIWCDLEGVAPGVTAPDVIAYCNLWHAQVAAAGYRPGLYVGWHAVLTSVQLYRSLRFDAYWSAYNLDGDQFPAVRGVQMRQRAVGVHDQVHGCPFEFDVNVIKADSLGGTPTLVLP